MASSEAMDAWAYMGFALLRDEEMLGRDDADMAAFGPGAIVIEHFLRDFPIVAGQAHGHGGHEEPVFRRQAGNLNGQTDVLHGFSPLGGAVFRGWSAVSA